jgi:hypothetical protein
MFSIAASLGDHIAEALSLQSQHGQLIKPLVCTSTG